jgi:chemotaxis protein methyltransferase CheR
VSGPPGSIDRLRAFVRDRAGLQVEGAREGLFHSALARAARASGRAPEEHASALLDATAPLQGFLEELSVGETWFFRDPEQWEFVERVVLAEARSRGPAVPFRAWSAGCASGEEPYSLAMLATEGGIADRTRIVATDLSEAALARARHADYSLWSLRGPGAARARRWLREAGGRLALDPEVAALVRFERLNLAEASYPSQSRGLAALDLVLCRNVLIYLDPTHVAAIARRLFDALAPGGWLIAGASDPALARHAPFEPGGPHGVYRRPVAGRAAAAPPAASRRAPAPAPAAPPRSASSPAAARPGRDRSAAAGRLRAKPPPPPEACADCRALLDGGRLPEALAAVDAAIGAAPMRPELHLMRALVLAELGNLDQAEAACRRAQYLSRDEPFVRFFLALLRAQRGDREGAARGLRRVVALCRRREPDEEIPLSEGLTAAGLAAAAEHHLERLAGPGRAAVAP